MSGTSAIYEGHVVHQRHRPKKHALRYRVFSILIDLDELEDLNRLRVFGYNRRALFSFWDKDHGHGTNPRDWVHTQLVAAGLPQPAKITLLCYPRILGYVFNPLTVWFCADASGEPIATIYEVHNTFHERHTYVLPANGQQAAEKSFYVSPFISMDCTYHFTVLPPGEKVRIAIDETEAGERLLFASFAGTRQPFTDATLMRLFFSYPLMTLKVTAGIYWEALKLWRKGITVFPHQPKVPPSASNLRKALAPAAPKPLDETQL